MMNLFLRQSYMDSWQEYQNWLEKGGGWDFIVLTASNEAQAAGYRQEIAYRRRQGCLSSSCEYLVLSDPEGKRVGSGGATLNVLKHLSLEYGDGTASVFFGKRILVIHSGGDSKRVPQYSVCGKLFSPVPRLLPDGRPSTLFDEFLVSMSAVAGRFESGMLVLSGDVLLLFNPLQLDFQYHGAAAISIKADVSVGKDHGVFLNDGTNYVKRFLHKQSVSQLESAGAVNGNGKVDLDTGAQLLDADLLAALFSLISSPSPEAGHAKETGQAKGHGQTKGTVLAERLGRRFDEKKFRRFVNEKARVSFYGDFLYPLAADSTLEDFYQEAAEGTPCPELMECRTAIWEALHTFRMKLICLSPAQFLHLGTTKELLSLVTKEISAYQFLDWSNVVNSNVREADGYAVYNSVIHPCAKVGKGSYVENSILGPGISVGEGSVVSGMDCGKGTAKIAQGVVLHGLRLPKGRYVARLYGVEDNPKDVLEQGALWLGEKVSEVLSHYGLPVSCIWDGASHDMWSARLYPVCSSMEEALDAAMSLYAILKREADGEALDKWLARERMSLHGSFNQALDEDALSWNKDLMATVDRERFLDVLRDRGDCRDALAVYAVRPMSDAQFLDILQVAQNADFSFKIRIYYALSRYLREEKRQVGEYSAKALEELCFGTIRATVCEAGGMVPGEGASSWDASRRIQRQVCEVELPVRVNWGGGWTDTPPFCLENGGIVLNAAIKLNGIYPVQVCARRLEEYRVEFASEDIGASGVFTELSEILDCRNPYDHFALHKAALIACGIVPAQIPEGPSLTLAECLRQLGGGIYLSTKVVGIPKGSGLGTSSILAGACVKALYEFLGEELPENEAYGTVLRMEQLMSTGGGWQDQVGGMCPGIKLITTKPGIRQDIRVERLNVSPKALEQLESRFALIYTGQRRLARNLLRDVVGSYIGGRPKSLEALEEIQRVTVLMKFELEKGNIDRFARLLNRHWELSLQLDGGASNTCIDQIFRSCEDLIDGRFIAGAGGGGFLQVILKKGVTAAQLNERLYEVFQDSGVGVWKCEFV